MATLNFPTLIVEAAFTIGAASSGYLYLGDAARGKIGTGTLAPDTLWQDISAYVEEITIQRGARRVDGVSVKYEAGTAVVVLDNSDRRFDPTNTAGPYVSAGVSQVTPMRAIRVRVVDPTDATTHGLFRGFADSWEVEWNDPAISQVTLHATDGIKVLSKFESVAVAAVGAGEDTGARITRVLNNAAWPADDRVLDVGDTTLQSTTLADGAWDEIQLAADSELGEVYIDTEGRLVFRRRKAILSDTRSTVSNTSYGDNGTAFQYEALAIQNDDVQVYNRAIITRSGGAAQQANDTASQSQYLTRTYAKSGLLMQDDTTALNYAQYVVFLSKDAELRFVEVEQLLLDDTNGSMTQALTRDIGDRITITKTPPGGGTPSPIVQDEFIRGITHHVKGLRWTTKWALQSATKFSFLTLDHATLGRLDYNALGY